MSEQLYIRVRGRVMGPYDRDKLQALVKRGQLGRLHEVSEDGVTWVRATIFPDLFVSSASNGNGARVQESPSQISALAGIDLEPEYPVTGAESAKSQTPGQQGWYYTSAGGQAGPVDFATLQRMVAGGQLSPGDLVWTDGMSQWSAPNQVPGLVPAASAAFSPHSLAHIDGERAEPQVSPDVSRALAGSKPWILFVAIMTFIIAGLTLIGGGALVLQGSRFRHSTDVIVGTFWILFAILAGIGGFMLAMQANRMGVFQHTRKDQHLAAALDAARIFWIYVGVLLIIYLTLAAIVGVWAVAIGPPF